jgi:RimJ/RimL family protein N-acetyltransferase
LFPAHDIPVAVPRIETGRLELRGHRADDLRDCAGMWGDPDVTRFIGGKPFSREEVWSKILRYAGHWTLLGFGYWVIADRVTGRFLGEAGFADFKRRIEPEFAGLPEIGWALASLAQGAGIATEAVHAIAAWGDQHFGNTTTVCLIHPDNTGSIRVAQKCGYREFRRTTYKEQPTILFQRGDQGNGPKVTDQGKWTRE